MNRKIDFLVQCKRSIMDIRASDGRPYTINYDSLGVHQSGFVFENFYS